MSAMVNISDFLTIFSFLLFIVIKTFDIIESMTSLLYGANYHIERILL